MPQTYPDGTTAGGGKFVMRGGQWYPVNSGPTVVGTPDPTQALKLPSAQADLDAKRQEAEQRRLAIEKARRDLANTPDPTAPAPLSPSSAVTGDEYLKTLPSTEATTVRGLAQGRLQFPTGAALRQPYWQKMLSNVVNFDPTFEQGDYGARYRLRNEFTSGKSASNIRALNTALSHARELQQAGKALDNFGGWETLLNGPRAAILSAKGDPRIKAFNTARQAFADELESVFANGGGSVSGRQDWRGLFSASDSPEQFQAAMAEAGKLLGGRVMALQDQYSRGMGPAAGIGEFFNKDAREVYPQLTGQPLPGVAPDGKNESGGIPGAGGGNGPFGGGGGPIVTGDGGQMVPGTGMNAVPNPAGKAILDQEQSLLANKASDDRIRAWAANVYGSVPHHIEEMLKARAAGIPIALNPGEGLLTKNVPADQGVMGKIGDAAATSPFAVLAGEAGNSAAAGLPQAMVRALSPNADMTDLRFNTARNAHDVASPLGQLAGGAFGALGAEGLAAKGISKLPFVYRGLSGADRAAAIAPWAARAGDATYGGVSGETSSPDSPLAGGALGAVAGLGGGITGRGVMRGVGKTLTGVVNPSVGYLDRAGVPLTLGQAVSESGVVGKAIKGIEDAMTSLPVVGDMIAYARNRGIKKFNGAAFKEGLAPVAKDIPPTIREQGVEMGLGKVGDAFDSALNGKTISLPTGPSSAFGVARDAGFADPNYGNDVRGIIDRNIAPLMDPSGNISGANFQKMDRSLDGYARKYGQVADGTPMVPAQPGAEAPRDAFRGMGDALDSSVAWSAPDVLPQYQAAKGAYRKIQVLRDAVNRARNGSRSGDAGVFMPSQLSDAAAANSRVFGGTQGTTNQPFFELSRAGQAVLPSKLADSGTAKRLMINAPFLAAGGGAYASGNETAQDTAGGAAVTLATLAAALSPAGQRVLRTAVLKRPDFLRKLGTDTLNNAAPYGGIFGAPVALQLQGK